jgi:hypothetical protein
MNLFSKEKDVVTKSTDALGLLVAGWVAFKAFGELREYLKERKIKKQEQELNEVKVYKIN